MAFHTRREALSWTDLTAIQGACTVRVAYGGFTHCFLVDPTGGAAALLYLGMNQVAETGAAGMTRRCD